MSKSMASFITAVRGASTGSARVSIRPPTTIINPQSLDCLFREKQPRSICVGCSSSSSNKLKVVAKKRRKRKGSSQGVEPPADLSAIVLTGQVSDPSAWCDLYTEAYRRRILFLFEDIEEENVNNLLGLMLYLDTEDPDTDQFLFINSLGGSLTKGFAMFDVMQHIKSDVQTVCAGMAASTACLVLASGTPKKRTAFPTSTTMIRQPTTPVDDGATSEDRWYGAPADEAYAEMLFLRDLTQRMTKIYALATGKPVSVIEHDLEGEEKFMTATEAQEYGIVDHVSCLPMASLFGDDPID